jgi:nitric oxide dioxygenase
VDKPAGQVSNWLHDKVTPGMLLHITHPFGDLASDTGSDKSTVLLNARVGITPVPSVLNRILEINLHRRVLFSRSTGRTFTCLSGRSG